MENIFSDRRKLIAEERLNVQKQLEEVSFKLQVNRWIAQSIEANITSMKPSKGILVERSEKGIHLQSKMNAEEHRYFHFDDVEELGNLMQSIDCIKNKLIALSFPGYANECQVEFRLTFVDILENKEEVRLQVGEKTIFRLNHLQSLKEIKMRLFIKGNGSSFFSNPAFLVKNRILDDVHLKSQKQYQHVHIMTIEKDTAIEKFKPFINLIPISTSNDFRNLTDIRPDLFLISSPPKIDTIHSHNSGYVDDSFLFDTLYWCVEHSIPAVYWDTDTPDQFRFNSQYAKYFDYVLTTNKESVDIYKKAGCQNVFYLSYKINLEFPNERESFFLKNILFVNDDPNKESLSHTNTDGVMRRTRRINALRNVLENNTHKNKIEYILDKADINYRKEPESATMLALIRSKQEYEEIRHIFNRQTMKNKKLLLLLDYFEGYLDIFNENNTGQIKTYLLDYIHHFDSMNEIIETSHFAPISTSHYYGKNYLKDMYLTTMYVQNAIIVKNIGKEYTYVTSGRFDQAFIPKSFTAALDLTEFVHLFDKDKGENLGRFFPLGIQFFNSDNFNLISEYEKREAMNIEHIEI